jgi:hypothetical protein
MAFQLVCYCVKRGSFGAQGVLTGRHRLPDFDFSPGTSCQPSATSGCIERNVLYRFTVRQKHMDIELRLQAC